MLLRFYGIESTDLDLSDVVHIMIMTLSGEGGILTLIAPVLKGFETYVFGSFLKLSIQRYLQSFKLIIKKLGVLWYMKYLLGFLCFGR